MLPLTATWSGSVTLVTVPETLTREPGTAIADGPSTRWIVTDIAPAYADTWPPVADTTATTVAVKGQPEPDERSITSNGAGGGHGGAPSPAGWVAAGASCVAAGWVVTMPPPGTSAGAGASDVVG